MIDIEKKEQKEWARIQSFELKVGARVAVKVVERCLRGIFAGTTGMQIFLREEYAIPGLPGHAPMSYDFTGRVQVVFFDHIQYIEADDKDIRIWECL
jgi:hypothetical protein